MGLDHLRMKKVFRSSYCAERLQKSVHIREPWGLWLLVIPWFLTTVAIEFSVIAIIISFTRKRH